MTAVPRKRRAAPAEPTEAERFERLATMAERDPSAPVLSEAERHAARRAAEALPRTEPGRMAEVDKILYGAGFERPAAERGAVLDADRVRRDPLGVLGRDR